MQNTGGSFQVTRLALVLLYAGKSLERSIPDFDHSMNLLHQKHITYLLDRSIFSSFVFFFQLFYEPMQKHSLLNEDELKQAFPNLLEILSLHREFKRSLEKLKKESEGGYVVKNIGDVLLERVSKI